MLHTKAKNLVMKTIWFCHHGYDDNRFAVLEWGSAFRWGEHYVLIQGEKGAIKLDMYNTKGTLRVDGKDTYFLIHETQEEDDDRTRIYNSTEMTVRFNTVTG